MLALQGMTPTSLERAVPELTASEARRVVSAVHRGLFHGGPIEHVRRVALDRVRAAGVTPALEVGDVQRSRVDPFLKMTLRTPAGDVIEAVRIPLDKPGRFSICVSSQVGCALACAFCATGRMGLRRNLETWEIVEQVRVIKRTLDPAAGERVRGVVFQGMGEPLANLDRVLEAIAVMTDPSALAIDARAITVCTAGLPAGILRLAREAPRVRLAWSIASARPDVRRRLMPIEDAHPLSEVLDAAAQHATATGLSPMWAVTPLAAENDGVADARALAALARAFVDRTGLRPRISLVPYNPISETDDPFTRSAEAAEAAFREVLRDAGFGTHKRYSGGGDVNAACGQLATASVRPVSVSDRAARRLARKAGRA